MLVLPFTWEGLIIITNHIAVTLMKQRSSTITSRLYVCYKMELAAIAANTENANRNMVKASLCTEVAFHTR